MNWRTNGSLLKILFEQDGRTIFSYTHFICTFKNCQKYYHWIQLIVMIKELVLFFQEPLWKVMKWLKLVLYLFGESCHFPLRSTRLVIFHSSWMVLKERVASSMSVGQEILVVGWSMYELSRRGVIFFKWCNDFYIWKWGSRSGRKCHACPILPGNHQSHTYQRFQKLRHHLAMMTMMCVSFYAFGLLSKGLHEMIFYDLHWDGSLRTCRFIYYVLVESIEN